MINNMNMYEAIIESMQQNYDLSMKMVKLEHTAIVNEDTNLLNEGKAEFILKAKMIVKNLVARFKQFIDKICAAFKKIEITIVSKLAATKVDPKKTIKVQLQYQYENGHYKKELAELDKAATLIAKVKPMDLLNTGNIGSDAKEALEAAKETALNYTKHLKNVDTNVEVNAAKFLKETVGYIRKLLSYTPKFKYFLSVAENVRKMIEKDENGDFKVANIQAYISSCNCVIDRIKSQVKQLINASLNILGLKKEISDDEKNKSFESLKTNGMKQSRKEKKAEKAAVDKAVASESYSILDMFD